MRRRLVLTLFLVTPVLLCPACGRNNGLHTVRGQVLFENRPPEHALVVLHPLGRADGDAVRPRGEVGPDGTFVLSTYGARDGAPAGEYGVTVEWWQTSGSKKNPQGYDAPPVNRLPARYARVESSGLRVQVKEGDNQLPPFQLRR